MKIKIKLSDGYEEIFEVDEEEWEIKDLGSTKEMLQAKIDELEEANRDKANDVAFYHEANKECHREIESLREKADGWEKRCTELEQELRDTQEKLDTRVDCNERIIAARDELRKQREALMKRLGDLEQETKALRERIQEQDVTIAKYDNENRNLRRLLGVHAIPLSIMEQADSVYAEARGIGKAFRCWAGIIHDNAVEHGWWDEERSFGDIVALCHSELSEALEEYRNGKPMSYEGEKGKPEGVAVEMIDCIIRILDWCGKESIDVDGLLAKKHDYNKGRPFRHGGKKL
jgi:FtsZ-binding cell division protein ZapB